MSHHNGTLLQRGSPTVQAKKGGASFTKCAVLSTEVVVLGMCNNKNGSGSRRRICAAMQIVGFIIESRGRAELGVAQD